MALLGFFSFRRPFGIIANVSSSCTREPICKYFGGTAKELWAAMLNNSPLQVEDLLEQSQELLSRFG